MSNRINSNGLIEKEKKMPEKTPLNGNTYVNSFQFKNEVLVFKASLPLRVLLFLLRILNICLWALILYHFYNGNFWIHSKAPFVVDIFINILLYISVPMLSIGLWYFRRKSRKKQFIDKQTQEINLFSNSDKKYTFKDIKAVQIIDYLKNIRTTSEFGTRKSKALFYQVNIVMRNNDRIIAFNTENEKKALSLSKQLNSHFGLPIIDQLQFKRKIYTRGFFRLHANFKEIIDIDRLTKKTSYKISKINDLEYVITNYDTFFTEMSFAPESIKALRVHFKIKKTSTLEKNEIILTTQFRYLDWVLPMIPICFLICYAENELLILVTAVVSAAFFYLSINNRVNENFMIEEILNLLIVDKEDVIFYY